MFRASNAAFCRALDTPPARRESSFQLMKSPGVTWKSVVFTFVAALAFYFMAYSWLSKRQTGKGPWQVEFTTNSAGLPQVIVGQASLGISNITVQFVGENLAPSNGTGVVNFARPKQITPFGRVAYDDLMFQPGVVALDSFGHLIEMAPVTLGLNGTRIGWTNGAVYSLFPTNKLSPEARQKLKGGYRR